ncbi:hypothetical protein [Nonomuraea sp. NPDC052265]|uniref:hypothetical protein n=1 Tax=Nonomuraea sp. NPDC052265 TaxID=3364374 RepID=UPI0037C944AB
MHIVNGIAQIWAREARWTYGAALLLADAYPDRHLLGLGFGGDPRPGTTPLKAMRTYLDEMDGLETVNPVPKGGVRRILAAYGAKMLELARDRAAGAQTYHVNVAHTAEARDLLGPDRRRQAALPRGRGRRPCRRAGDRHRARPDGDAPLARTRRRPRPRRVLTGMQPIGR